MRFIFSFDDFLKKLSVLDFVPLFLIRVYLFFVFWFAGVEKIENTRYNKGIRKSTFENLLNFDA